MIRKSYFISLFLMLIFNCVPEAPHDNALDPYHISASESGIELLGEVIQKVEPHPPISECLVLMLPEQQFDTTGIDGRFSFINILPGLHQIIINKSGFDTDTFQIIPDTVQRNPVHFPINGTPIIKKSRVYSQYIDQWWPDPVIFINFETIIEDSDGISDIEDVRIEIPALNLLRSLNTTARPDSFTMHLSDLDFPDNNIFSAIGKIVNFIVMDKSDSRGYSAPQYLIRIIDTSPETVEPSGLQTVGSRPILKWSPYLTLYPFTYEVSVFFVTAGIPVLIHYQNEIDSTVNQYQYPDSLVSGTYFWTVAVRDDLKNLSRSKEASFLVQ
jgi:hypothetical protein